MDADCIERQRDQLLSRREKRWSMNSQRLEEIVAELMRPISDVRRSFDTDLSALLEEYLTEAGLRALDAGEDASAEVAVAPNYMELALLLQQSAHLYGRKVDCLYQDVLVVSESLHNCTQELGHSSSGRSEEPAAASGSRRRRRVSTLGGAFCHIELEAAAGARRDAGPARPPPTLPRMYIELEPRVIAPADAPLLDYAGEPIGLLSDFQVTWRLHEGLLVDELEDGTRSDECALRPISLVELQAAIEAAAPPPPAAHAHDESPPRSPLRASTPLASPAPPAPPAPPSPPAPPATPTTSAGLELVTPSRAKCERKRRSEVRVDDIIEGGIKIFIDEDVRQKLNSVEEFCISARWIKRVVTKRKSHILSERRRLRALEPDPPPEFPGWSGGAAPVAAVPAAAKGGREPDSEDDGFFEQSSVGESDASRAEEAAGGGGAWQARVLQRAEAQAARGALDVRSLGARVLRALPPAGPRAFPAVLGRAATHRADVSRLFLATLFLANAGNVEIVQGPPLTVNSFSLRLLSPDQSLFSAAAADEQFLQ